MDNEAKPRMKAIDVAVGMGIPFRAVLYLVGCPVVFAALIIFAICEPHGSMAGELLDWFPQRLWWVWYGKRKGW